MKTSNFTQAGHITTIPELSCTTYVNGIYHQITILVLNILLSIVAFVGNVLILIALKKASSPRPPAKLLLSCLARTDLCVGLFIQPLYIASKMSEEHSKLCFNLQMIFNITSTIFAGVSMFTLTAISVDRLLALLIVLRYRQIVTLRKVWVFVVIFWVFSTVTAMMFFYDYGIAIGVIFIIAFLCFVTSTFCYTKIYLKLRSHQAQVQENLHQGQSNGGRISLNIARYKKTASSALWIQITLMACYLPYIVTIAVYIISGSRPPSLDFAWSVALTLCLLNSSLNPILYCWKIKDVRKAVKDTIRQLRCLTCCMCVVKWCQHLRR